MKNKLYLLIITSLIIKVISIYLFISVFRSSPWSGHMHVDIWGWLSFFNDLNLGKIPYVDFSKEYPIGIGIFFWFTSIFLKGNSIADPLLNFHIIFFPLFDIINGIILYKIIEHFNPKKAFFYSFIYLILPTNLILTPFRYESLVTLTFFISIFYYLKNKTNISAIYFSLGTLLKWYPAILFAVSEWKNIFIEKKIRFRTIVNFLAVILIFNMPFIVIGYLKNGNIYNLYSTYIFHVKRALYFDTPFGAISLWYGYPEFEKYLSIISLFLMAVIFFVKPKMDIFAKTASIIILALICNRVYSTQFHLWFIPLIFIYLSYNKNLFLLYLVISIEILNILIYPFIFTYSSIELKGFNHGMAIKSGTMVTWCFTFFIMLRSYMLIEILNLLINSKNKIYKLMINSVRILAILLIFYFSFDTYRIAKNNEIIKIIKRKSIIEIVKEREK